jgi:hypothetical protein
MAKRNDLTGNVYGRLTVLQYHHTDERGRAFWLCRCECGNEHIAMTALLCDDRVKSCGCLLKDSFFVNNPKQHGLAGTPEYRSWNAVKFRCYNEKSSDYADYGAKGITMYEPWKDSFLRFLEDVGHRPSPIHTLDRIENSKGYYPGNVRWATPEEQATNRRTTVMVEYKGELMSISQLSRKTGIHQATLNYRIHKGMTGDQAASKPWRNS